MWDKWYVACLVCGINNMWHVRYVTCLVLLCGINNICHVWHTYYASWPSVGLWCFRDLSVHALHALALFGVSQPLAPAALSTIIIGGRRYVGRLTRTRVTLLSSVEDLWVDWLSWCCYRGLWPINPWRLSENLARGDKVGYERIIGYNLRLVYALTPRSPTQLLWFAKMFFFSVTRTSSTHYQLKSMAINTKK